MRLQTPATASEQPLLALVDEDSRASSLPNLVQPSIYALMRSWVLIAVMAGLGGLGGLVYGLLQPNTYESDGRLYVMIGKRESAATEATVRSGETPLASSYEALLNELQILEHVDVYERTLERVGVDRVLKPYDPLAADDANTPVWIRWMHQLQSKWFATTASRADPSLSREEAALKALRVGIEIERLGNSRAISVRYLAQDPAVAREVVAAFLAAAEEHHREVFSNEQSLEFLVAQEQAADAAVDQAVRAFTEFKREHDLTEPDLQAKTLSKAILDLELEAAAAEERVKDLQKQQKFLLEEQRSTNPEAYQDVVNPPGPNPQYQWLQQQLFDLGKARQAAEAQAEGTMAERQQRLAAIDALIENAKRQLAETSATLAPTITKTLLKNPRYAWLQEHLDEIALELAAAQDARSSSQALLREHRQRLDQIKSLEPEFVRLAREVERLQARATKLHAGLEEASMLNLLDQSKLSNLRVLEGASYPLTKSGPRRGRHLVLGVGLGVFLGIGLAFGRQMLDLRLRRLAEVNALGESLLAAVPRQRGVRRPRGAVTVEALSDPDRTLAPWRSVVDELWGSLLPDGLPTRPLHMAFIGAGRRVGTTSLAACAAVGLARHLQVKVVLVEANRVSPGLARLARTEPGPGLTDVLASQLGLAAAIKSTGVPGLELLLVGDTNLPTAFAGEPFEALFSALGARADVVIYDVPPLHVQPTVRPLLWRCRRVIGVVRHGGTTKAEGRRLVEAVRDAGVESLGLVFNGHVSVRPFWLPAHLDPRFS